MCGGGGGGVDVRVGVGARAGADRQAACQEIPDFGSLQQAAKTCELFSLRSFACFGLVSALGASHGLDL